MSVNIPQQDERFDLRVSTLSPRDWEAFLTALDNAHRRRPHLEEAAQRYQGRRLTPNTG